MSQEYKCNQCGQYSPTGVGWIHTEPLNNEVHYFGDVIYYTTKDFCSVVCVKEYFAELETKIHKANDSY